MTFIPILYEISPVIMVLSIHMVPLFTHCLLNDIKVTVQCCKKKKTVTKKILRLPDNGEK